MGWILFIISLASIYGIISGEIPLGIILVLSLFSFIFLFNVKTSKDVRLTNTGIFNFTVAILAIIYCVCVLFFHIDLKSILGI